MLSKGFVKIEGLHYILLLSHNKKDKYMEAILMDGNSQVYSAYKEEGKELFIYNNNKAKLIVKEIQSNIKKCTAKNAVAAPFNKGTVSRHTLGLSKGSAVFDLYRGDIAGVEIEKENVKIYSDYTDNIDLINNINIPYIKSTTRIAEYKDGQEFNQDIPVRSLKEIQIETGKDLTWLNEKKYYIIDNEETAEKIFQYLDTYEAEISLDYETTGTKINMFSKIGSKYKNMLDKYNETRDYQDKIFADKLVGVILCVEPNISYYFPVANRKFKNLYEDKNEMTLKTIQYIREQNKIKDHFGELDISKFIRNTTDLDMPSDVILMERLRLILENKHIVAQFGSFEWKVSYCYDIVLNLKDDTGILHQLMYKFRSTTSNRGEPSNLKYLTKVELGIDQLDLKDFFIDFTEEAKEVRGSTKNKKKKIKIDFSYMDYEGARAYGPADGDFTLQIYYKYKKDLIENNEELIYLYNIEIMVEQAIAYMEFYGHRIDEDRIKSSLDKAIQERSDLEQSIRKLANLKDEEPFKLTSPKQVAELFFKKLEIPNNSDKLSVDKKTIKQFKQFKNDDGTDKYPIIHLYDKWKKIDTLITKFYDKLPDFMYPGGYIFSSYGQITTATGRMSCKNPNAQQYPDAVKELIVPRENCVMLDADYSQIEYRVLVSLAMENLLIEDFKNFDNDYHTRMASLMYDVLYAAVSEALRNEAKGLNFGIPYGMGFKSIALILFGKATKDKIDEAAEKYELYFKAQPNVRKFFALVKERAAIYKYTQTYFKRYRYYSFVDENGNESNAKRAMALRQAGNAVIQGTAADIFKIGIARLFYMIKKNNLLGKFFISNLIHDEILSEIDVTVINAQKALAEVEKCMSFELEGFPPLFIGAGFGSSWKQAKGGRAEIHAILAEQLSKEVEHLKINEPTVTEPKEILEYFRNRVRTFRFNKIMDYITNEKNWNKPLDPAIGKTLSTEFSDGFDEKIEKEKLVGLVLQKFIKDNELDDKLSVETFEIVNNTNVEIDDVDYDDTDEDFDDIEVDDGHFTLIDEEESLYGVSLQEIIKIFGFMVSYSHKICGIDTSVLTKKRINAIVEYLLSNKCEKDDDNSLQIVFLKENNILFSTGIYVRNISGEKLARKLNLNTAMYV